MVGDLEEGLVKPSSTVSWKMHRISRWSTTSYWRRQNIWHPPDPRRGGCYIDDESGQTVQATPTTRMRPLHTCMYYVKSVFALVSTLWEIFALVSFVLVSGIASPQSLFEMEISPLDGVGGRVEECAGGRAEGAILSGAKSHGSS